jgi:hypothetical protein
VRRRDGPDGSAAGRRGDRRSCSAVGSCSLLLGLALATTLRGRSGRSCRRRAAS